MALDFMEFNQYDLLRSAYKELFSTDYEQVWILNSEEVQLKENLQYYPPMPEPPPPPPPPPPRPGPMVFRVPMCCADCAERMEAHLKTLSGIEKFTCDWKTEKVTVLGAEKDPISAVDLLSECRRVLELNVMLEWVVSDKSTSYVVRVHLGVPQYFG